MDMDKASMDGIRSSLKAGRPLSLVEGDIRNTYRAVWDDGHTVWYGVGGERRFGVDYGVAGDIEAIRVVGETTVYR
jgi:hypothetical protein